MTVDGITSTWKRGNVMRPMLEVVDHATIDGIGARWRWRPGDRFCEPCWLTLGVPHYVRGLCEHDRMS